MLERIHRSATWTTTVVLLAATTLFVAAQQAGDIASPQTYRTEMERADQRIDVEVRRNSELVGNLEYLTTRIGPRLTGTPQMEAAARWALQRFRAYGLDAHLETMTIAHAWYRGADTATMIAPIERRIEVRSLGWSKATPGEITAPVVFLENGSPATVAANKARLSGAIVMLGNPRLFAPENPDNAYDAVIPLPRSVAAPPPQTGRGITPELVAAMPAAILLDSNKIYNLFNMGSVGGDPYQPSGVPTAFLPHEEYSLIYQLQKENAVTVKLNVTGTFSAAEQPASIVVAEIKGTARPDEHVVVAGHLDSWDLGQGALDNGTGAMAVLEAARTLKTLGWRSDRTLTFILFPGEEQGLRGSQWYVRQHASELSNIDAMLVHDTGTGRVFSIALEGLYETAPLITRVYEPLQDVFDLQPLTNRTFTGSDHVPFLQSGVPAYFCVQRPAHYGEAHHSQTDTFDKVIPDDINEGAAVLAAWMWNVSQLTESLPHHPATR